MKTCLRCKTNQPLENFSRDRSRRSGLSAYCRTCMNKQGKQVYLRIMNDPKLHAVRRTQHRAEANRRYKKNPEVACVAASAAYARHLDRNRARRKVRLAVASGALSKPKTCSQCNGVPLPRRLHGHHEDYAKPLEVEWLCSGCHGDRTREQRQ